MQHISLLNYIWEALNLGIQLRRIKNGHCRLTVIIFQEQKYQIKKNAHLFAQNCLLRVYGSATRLSRLTIKV